MTGISRYCTIQDLEALVVQQTLINLVMDRSGASITDYDVVRQLEKFIAAATADLEGEIRRYRTVPFSPTITPLTGQLEFERGNVDVNLIDGDLTEYSLDMEFRPDDYPDVRMIVREIGQDTDGNFITCWNVFYNEFDLRTTPDPLLVEHSVGGVAASKYEWFIPKEVRTMVANHCAYTIWERRAKGAANPLELEEARYQKMVEDIREGKFRFDREGEVTHKLPTVTDFTVKKTFTSATLRDYRPGEPD